MYSLDWVGRVSYFKRGDEVLTKTASHAYLMGGATDIEMVEKELYRKTFKGKNMGSCLDECYAWTHASDFYQELSTIYTALGFDLTRTDVYYFSSYNEKTPKRVKLP
jgi:hypothetical protein